MSLEYVSIWILLLVGVYLSHEQEVQYTNTWAVKIDGGAVNAERLAHKYGFINKGKVG